MGMNFQARALRAKLRHAAVWGLAVTICFITASYFAAKSADGQQQRSSRRTANAPAPKPVAKPVAPAPVKPKPTASKPVAAPAVAAPTPPQPKRETVEPTKPNTVARPEAAKPVAAKPSETVKPEAAKPGAAKTPTVAKTPMPTVAPTLAPIPTTGPEVKSAMPGKTPTAATPRPRITELFAPPPLGGVTNKNQNYLLRYKFAPGETVRWNVEHQAKIATTVEGASQTAETLTRSVKCWKVGEVNAEGETVFVHSVESIDMRQKISGRQETTYNSATDKEVPPMFQQAATQVGVPLAQLTIDSRGKVIKRVDGKVRPEGSVMSDITLVLPENPLAIGESWSTPFDMSANDKGGVLKIIKARKKLTLESVTNNIAVLRHETQILSPLKDPTIEAQVVQSEQSGTVRFDLAAGRIVSIEMTNDRVVFGFQGDASVMHVDGKFSEHLSTGAAATPQVKAEPTAAPEDKTAAKAEGKSTK